MKIYQPDEIPIVSWVPARDAGERINDLEAQLAECQRERDALREALLEIKNNYGRVCAEYQICEHESCRSSYSAWAVADMALAAIKAKENDGE